MVIASIESCKYFFDAFFIELLYGGVIKNVAIVVPVNNEIIVEAIWKNNQCQYKS